MKRTMGGAVLMAAMMALAPIQGDAQMGPRGQRGTPAGPRGAGVEMLLRQKAQLELTDAQVRSLEQLRQEVVQRRTAQQAEAAELRSKVRAGQADAAAFREQALARREAALEVQKQHQARVEAVLNDAQKQKIEGWGDQARAQRMGRMDAMRGRMMAPGAAWGGRGGAWGGPHGRGAWRGRGGGMGFGPPWADSVPRIREPGK